MKFIFNNKYLNYIIKAAVVALFLFIIYKQITTNEKTPEFLDTFVNNLKIPSNIIWLVAVIVLVPINWAMETLKWTVLIKQFEKVGFFHAYKTILMGVAFSMLTPNRIGEYGGRILLVNHKNRWRAVIATLLGSFSQIIVLLFFGLLGSVFFSVKYLKIELYIIQIISILGWIFFTLLSFLYYNIDMLVPIFLIKIPFSKKIRRYIKHIKVLRSYDTRTLSLNLIYSLIRYLIYTLQYYFVLNFLNIEVPLLEGIACISTVFLLQTSLPLPPITGLFARGEIALYVWRFFTPNDISILAATFGLWVINLVIPALLGLFFIINTNITKALGMKD